MNNKEYDIVIAGGGIVGCAAALALSKSTSYSIAVIEAFEPSTSTTHPSFDARVVALAKESFVQLESFGINMRDDDLNCCPIQHIHVSDRGHLGQVQLTRDNNDLRATTYGQPSSSDENLGYVVSLADLGSKMLSQLQQTDIDYLCPEKIVSIERHQNCTKLQLNKLQIDAKLVLIAEGGQSPSRSLFSLKATQYDYAQSAIIANVITQAPHENRAFERFTSQGPIALLPMHTETHADTNIENGKQMSLVWTIDKDKAATVMGMSDKAFLAKLQQLFGDKLGRFTAVSTRHSYPLSLIQVPAFTSHRVICLGNAAQSLHPIAGQGFNLGVRDIVGLVQVLDTLSGGHDDEGVHAMRDKLMTQNTAVLSADPGAFVVTNAYKKHRIKDKQNVITATDALVRIFSNQYLPFTIGRNLSLIALNHHPRVKNTLASFAMGER